jgi:hypothetical protein
MSKEFYINLPEHIRTQLYISDEERQRMGLDVLGGPITAASRKRRLATLKRVYGMNDKQAKACYTRTTGYVFAR